jgi:hypothetical protein
MGLGVGAWPFRWMNGVPPPEDGRPFGGWANSAEPVGRVRDGLDRGREGAGGLTLGMQ